MRRKKRFPLYSLLTLLCVGGVIAFLTYIDADAPDRALQQVWETAAHVGSGLSIFSQSVVKNGFTSGNNREGEESRSPNKAEPAALGDVMPLLVNGGNPLPEGYEPQDLVRMQAYCDGDVVSIKDTEAYGSKEAVDALMAMLSDAVAEGISNWQISEGYRSIAYQRQLWLDREQAYQMQGLSYAQAQEATSKQVAVPGGSEHHTGLAFDITVPGESFPLTPQSKWLSEHCWEYGFIIRYTEEKQEITGIIAEPWHVRYVGQPHARIMYDKNLCLEEYILYVQ